jgi:SAM-dependent methyltransferase
MKGFEYVPGQPCNFCRSTEQKVIYRPKEGAAAADFSVSSNSIGTQTIVECIQCGLRFARIDQTSERILRALADSEAGDYLSQEPQREETFRRYFKVLNKLLPPQPKVLDVGTGAGAFLRVAKENGYVAYGVEMNHSLVNVSRQTGAGLTVFEGGLEAANFESQSFDLVCFWDSLEHMLDPKEHLEEARRCLKPKGLLLINFPDVSSFWARTMKARWWFYISVHFYYFSTRYLVDFLRRQGFDHVYARRHRQTLQLGHVLKQAENLSPLLIRPIRKLVEAFGLERLQLTYWAGQHTIICQKA